MTTTTLPRPARSAVRDITPAVRGTALLVAGLVGWRFRLLAVPIIAALAVMALAGLVEPYG